MNSGLEKLEISLTSLKDSKKLRVQGLALSLYRRVPRYGRILIEWHKTAINEFFGSRMNLRIIISLIFCSSHLKGQDKILPPSTAPKVIPPYTTLEQATEDLRIKQKKSEKNKKSTQDYQKKKEKDAKPAKSPWKTYSRVSLMIPYVKTSGNFRDNYIVEPGMNFNLARRWGSGNPYNEKTFWYGLRIASFSGSGTYQDQNGRFNFLYWGPSFSFLILNDPRVYQKKSNDKGEKKLMSSNNSQNSWRWSFGLSAFSRYGAQGSELNPGDGDFSNLSYGIDIPGVWTEITYGRIFGKTTSIDGTFGIQAGESKLFVYLSVGMGLWY